MPVQVDLQPSNADQEKENTGTADHTLVEHPQTNSNNEMAGTNSSLATVKSAAKRSPLAELV